MPETLSEVFARLLVSARKTGRRDDVDPSSVDEEPDVPEGAGTDTSQDE